jgi:hypothetical protein
MATRLGRKSRPRLILGFQPRAPLFGKGRLVIGSVQQAAFAVDLWADHDSAINPLCGVLADLRQTAESDLILDCREQCFHLSQ